MMLQAMPCIALCGPANLPCSGQLCQHSLLGGRVVLMRKKVELARQSFKLINLQVHSGGHRPLSSGRRGHELPSRHAGTDPLSGQKRYGSSGNFSPDWEHKRVQTRDKEETLRMQQSGISSLAQRQRSTGPKTFAMKAAPAPNDPRLAQARAHPHDAAQPSHVWPAHDPPSPNGSLLRASAHSPSRPASVVRSTATQPSSADIIEQKEKALREDDLHSPALSHLSSLQVRTAFAHMYNPETFSVGRMLLHHCIVLHWSIWPTRLQTHAAQLRIAF